MGGEKARAAVKMAALTGRGQPAYAGRSPGPKKALFGGRQSAFPFRGKWYNLGS
jgi:hypothetical protein